MTSAWHLSHRNVTDVRNSSTENAASSLQDFNSVCTCWKLLKDLLLPFGFLHETNTSGTRTSDQSTVRIILATYLKTANVVLSQSLNLHIVIRSTPPKYIKSSCTCTWRFSVWSPSVHLRLTVSSRVNIYSELIMQAVIWRTLYVLFQSSRLACWKTLCG